MRNLTEDNVTEAVMASFAGAQDPRTRQVLQALVRHLHNFVREVEPTEAEWMQGIQFLTDVGHMCDDVRQEYILLSDVLGASILMDCINHRRPAGTTESSLLGPFYRESAPDIAPMGSISRSEGGEPAVIEGRVTDADGNPIADAVLDIWQTNANGLYEVQDAEQPEFNLRGKLKTDADGRYVFKTVKPVSYPIPDDGPVGKMLRAGGRHPYRPAHVHFIVSADGFEPVVTQLFTEGDAYLDSDAVFGVKGSLVVDFAFEDSADAIRDFGMDGPFHKASYDFGLVRAA